VASACGWSVALVGLEGRIVEVEADIGAGLPRTVLVGLPDSALYQARDRCKAAVSNSGQEWPISLLTINLSPATLPKAGSHYDLAIVAAILAAQGIFRADELRRTVLLGELGLDGRVRPIRGVLPATVAAQQAGFTRVIVPLRQAGEAKLVAGIDVFGIASITQLVALLHDSLEVSAVHSLAGFNLANELITRPPYSDPHHSASVASIVGGGQRIARPRAISCAHKGVLFLDDSTEAQSIQWCGFILVIADALSKVATDNLTAKFASAVRQPGVARVARRQSLGLAGVGLGGFSSGRAMAQLRNIRSVSAA
jgi:predicted ATPase with chaperone activity